MPPSLANPGPARQRRERAEWIVFVLATASFAALVGYALRKDHTDVGLRESDRLQVQARVVDENLSRQFIGLAKTLFAETQEFNEHPAAAPTAATSRRMATLTNALPGVRTMLLADAHGVVLASNRPELVGREVGHREYFVTAQKQPDPRRVYISRPFNSALGVWVVNVSKVLTDAKGQFAGIVTAGLDPDYFNVVLKSVLYAPDMRTTLVHGAGEVFLNMPVNPKLLGLNVAVPGSFFSRHLESGRADTLLVGETAATGEERMVASRTLQAGLAIDKPLVIHVSRESEAMYGPWRRQALQWSGTCVVLIVGMALGLALTQSRRRVIDAAKTSANQERVESERRLRAITDHLPALISHFDRDQVCTFTNPYCGEVYGVDHRSMVGQSVPAVRGEREYAKLKPHIDRALAGERASFENRTTIAGVERVLQQTYIPDIAPDGTVQGFYSISHDVTALKQVQQRLADQARIDSLTGIPNRRLFDERLPEAMARCRRDQRPTALLMLDVDDFKAVNDTRGHAAGDEVLKEFSRRLQQCVRETDTIARLAGDEFVIILEGLRSVEEAGFVAQKIVQAMRDPIELRGGAVDVSTSVGVAVTGFAVETPQVLMTRADQALYEAKRAGRNTFVIAA